MHSKQHTFIAPIDEVAKLINEKAGILYHQLLGLELSGTDIDEFGKYYFNNHHAGKRLIFSIESSADIIYQSVKLSGDKINNLTFIDYGAGLGTLFLLAGMVGFKQVYFNDYFPQWAGYAASICKKLNIEMDGYISGDIDAVIDYGKANNVSFDIVASRNVVEHIYNLRSFYLKLFNSGLTKICYATTTANYHNPAMRLKHYFYHAKVEKTLYKKQRAGLIKELKPAIAEKDLHRLVAITRGRAFNDFSNAVNLYSGNKPVTTVEFLGTNTCDSKTGVWAENLLSRYQYFDIIKKAGFTVSFSAGFWDTNYKYAIANFVTSMLNHIIKVTGKKGYWFSPFVNIVAIKK